MHVKTGFLGLFSVLIFNTCSMSKRDIISCDIDTGICLPPSEITTDPDAFGKDQDQEVLHIKYYYDPLCGWCFGFSPVISQIKDKYDDKVKIQVISGGLFLGERAGSVNQAAPHIKAGAYRSVEQRTGVKFGKVFLDDVFGPGILQLNSLPPTIALSIVKEHSGAAELKFAQLLLQAIYGDGVDISSIDNLAILAEQVGLEKRSFIQAMEDPKYHKLVEEDFHTFAKSRYAGMPSLVAQKDGKEHLITYGYSSFNTVDQKLAAFLP